jgi:hypothetical protein
LLALADASSVYLRGGRDFSDGTTAVFVGGSSDPRGDFEKARQEFVSAADQAGIHLGRKSCTEWLKRNP